MWPIDEFPVQHSISGRKTIAFRFVATTCIKAESRKRIQQPVLLGSPLPAFRPQLLQQRTMTDSGTRIGIAVVEHRGRYLVGTRRADGPLPGLDEFPGGKCCPGESANECAVRECCEETGLQVEPVELLLNRQFKYAHGEVDLHFWLCRPVDETAIAEDHHGYRWNSITEIATKQFPEANEPVIAELISRSQHPD